MLADEGAHRVDGLWDGGPCSCCPSGHVVPRARGTQRRLHRRFRRTRLGAEGARRRLERRLRVVGVSARTRRLLGHGARAVRNHPQRVLLALRQTLRELGASSPSARERWERAFHRILRSRFQSPHYSSTRRQTRLLGPPSHECRDRTDGTAPSNSEYPVQPPDHKWRSFGTSHCFSRPIATFHSESAEIRGAQSRPNRSAIFLTLAPTPIRNVVSNRNLDKLRMTSQTHELAEVKVTTADETILVSDIIQKAPVEDQMDADLYKSHLKAANTPDGGESSSDKVIDIADNVVANGAPPAVDFTAVKVPLPRLQFALVFLGLVLAIAMAALDQTIVSTALKSIVAEFGHQELVAWIGSSYLLTAAPFGILYGKLADLFGRKWVFVFTLVIFEVGSAICGAAPDMTTLILGRAIAGVGGGGIFSLVLIIISDIVSMQDRGKFQGMLGAVFGLCSVIGPLLGGAFSDHVSWRWCFFINLPLGVVTVGSVIAFLKFPSPTGTFMSKVKRIDFLGTIFVFASIICLVTPLQLGGTTWDWNSAPTIVGFVLFAVFGAIFVYIENKIAKEPIIPPSLFVNSSVPALLVIAFCVGSGFFSATYYISLFFQVVNGLSATAAGVQTIPLVMGVSVCAISSGIAVSKTGRYKIFFYIGPCLMIVGAVLISYLDVNSTSVQKVFYLLIFGLGGGSLIQTRVLGIQASVPLPLIAVATALSQTCVTLGGAFSISVCGTLFNNIIASNLPNYPNLTAALLELHAHRIYVPATEVLPLSDILQSSPFIQNPAAATSDLIQLFQGAFHDAYLSLIAYPLMILLMTFFVKEFAMKGRGGPPAAAGR
ncbi:major facilitator superfamily domain-containing protein [Chytriomyces sp. MP71]|nr:major facilitator superfamily domain-containing protein [Chytriomyces sp. MP71]